MESLSLCQPRNCTFRNRNVAHVFPPLNRMNRVPPPEEEWMRRDAEANAAAAFYYHQQQSADEYVLTDDEVLMQSSFKRLGCMIQPQRRVHSTFPLSC